jgi:hypothetical protein
MGSVLVVAMIWGTLAPYFWRRYPGNKRRDR